MEIDMTPNRYAALKSGFKFATVLAALTCVAASCGPRHSAMSGPRCAFADPEATTSMGICNLAAEYYVAHHEWPLSKAQLEEQNRQLLEGARAQMSWEEATELSEFLDRFTFLDLRKSGQDLVMRYRFKVERKTVDQTVTLRPRATADEILQAATAKGYD
jgi:hypothetical protein